jgi:hypothetical protein
VSEARRRRLAGYKAPALAWHYTDLMRAALIIESGTLEASCLNPHSGGVLTSGQRLIWFTTDASGERSASCGQAARRFGIPAVRFGLPLTDTLPAREGCLAAGWSLARIEEDERLGRRMGARPTSWRVVIADALPVDVLTPAEVWHGGAGSRLTEPALPSPALSRPMLRCRTSGIFAATGSTSPSSQGRGR